MFDWFKNDANQNQRRRIHDASWHKLVEGLKRLEESPPAKHEQTQINVTEQILSTSV